jgi:hypothetical protein
VSAGGSGGNLTGMTETYWTFTGGGDHLTTEGGEVHGPYPHLVDADAAARDWMRAHPGQPARVAERRGGSEDVVHLGPVILPVDVDGA